ncbi:hypothetical protein DRN97_09950, partial [Methanosarcinales archaeon]
MGKILVSFFVVLILASSVVSALKILIVYTSDYEAEDIIDLPLAEKDAMHFKNAMSLIPGVDVKVLANPSLGNFIRTFKAWAESSKDVDTLVFYYAGHGISKGGKFYFIPVDADFEDEYTWVKFDRLKEYIPWGAKVIWLIEACYSNSVVKSKPLKVVRMEKGAFKAGTNEVIITSSSGNEISKEMPDGSGGIFTVSLVEGLEGKADENGDGWIESGELYRYVSEKVKERSQEMQHPMMEGSIDLKIMMNVSGKIKELKTKLYEAYDTGQISEQAFNNVKALIEGEECTGKGLKDLKEAINEYVSGRTSFKMLLIAIKAYAENMRCEGAEVVPQPRQEKSTYKPAGTAFLKIIPKSELAQGAKVYIDRQFAGQIEGEIFSVEVKAGKHKVLVTSEKMEDVEFEFEVKEYEEYEKEIQGEPVKRVVKIITDPLGAKIYIDGEYKGTTPNFVKMVVGKTHEVVLKKVGYKILKEKLYIPYEEGIIEKTYKLEKLKMFTWQKCLGGSKSDVAHSIQQTNDGGYIVAGCTHSNDGDVSGWHEGYDVLFGITYNDFWVVKLDSEGN